MWRTFAYYTLLIYLTVALVGYLALSALLWPRKGNHAYHEIDLERE